MTALADAICGATIEEVRANIVSASCPNSYIIVRAQAQDCCPKICVSMIPSIIDTSSAISAIELETLSNVFIRFHAYLEPKVLDYRIGLNPKRIPYSALEAIEDPNFYEDEK